jgi:hypothetical protein
LAVFENIGGVWDENAELDAYGESLRSSPPCDSPLGKVFAKIIFKNRALAPFIRGARMCL